MLFYQWLQSSCHFVNLLSFASSSFFLSLRKIMCLNSQQPKTRGHVEHGTLALKYFATVKKFKIQMLYKMYKLDFKMFDYDIQPYLDVGRDWIKKYVLCLDNSLYFHERNSSIVITPCLILGSQKLNSFVSWEGSSWISALNSKVWYV